MPDASSGGDGPEDPPPDCRPHGEDLGVSGPNGNGRKPGTAGSDAGW
jgi:hypothetical protein